MNAFDFHATSYVLMAPCAELQTGRVLNGRVAEVTLKTDRWCSPQGQIDRSFIADCVLCLNYCHADAQPISGTSYEALKSSIVQCQNFFKSPDYDCSIYSLYCQIVCWFAAPVLHAAWRSVQSQRAMLLLGSIFKLVQDRLIRQI